MKYRSDFVTNSSSSSYIVVINGSEEKCPHCGRSGSDLSAYLKSRNDDYSDTKLTSDNISGIMSEIQEWWDADKAREIKSKMEEATKQGKGVLMFNIDYSDEGGYHILEEHKKNNLIEILYDCS